MFSRVSFVVFVIRNMEWNSTQDKSEVIVKNTSNGSVGVTMDGESLEEMSSFKFFGATLSKDGTSKGEIRRWIATATTATARVERILKSNISFHTMFKLYTFLVVPILFWD